MTNKQKEYIEFIEEMTGISFKGNPNNNKDISSYINTYKDLANLNSLDSWQLRYV